MKSYLCLVLALAASVLGRAVRLAPIFSDGDVIPDSYIVQLREPDMAIAGQPLNPDYSEFVEQHLQQVFGQGFADRQIERLNLGYSLTLTHSEVENLRLNQDVDFIEQNQRFYPSEIQKRPRNWGLDRISQRQLPLNGQYPYSDVAGEGVDVYVVDTGINIEHEDFEGRAIWGYTAPANDRDIDGNGHGTHVASTIVGKAYGVAKKANVYAVKVLRSSGYGSTVDVLKGIDWVGQTHAAKKAKNGTTKSVANMSLGGGKSNALELAVERSTRLGVLFAVAAGNENSDACKGSPSGSPAALTVGATNRFDIRSVFSNWGSCVDIFAPGSGITAAWTGGKTVTKTISGTSMASPHVCGVMALFLAEKDFTPEELKAEVLKAATKNVVHLTSGSPNLLLFSNPPVSG